MNVAELVIKLLLDGSGVKTEATRVDGSLADVEKQAGRAGDALDDMADTGRRGLEAVDHLADRAGAGIASLARRVGGALAALWSVDSLKNMAAAYYQQAEAIDRTAQSLGLSIERMQAWQGAAAAAGGEAEDMADRFRDMSDYIIDATKFDSGPLKDIAGELGISLKTAQGEVRTTEDVLLDLADAFQRVGEQASTAYGMQMSFDPATIALLQKGRGELEALLKAQQEQAAFSREDAELARRQKIAVLQLHVSWQGFVNGLMRMAAPVITSITEGMGKLTAFLARNSRAISLALAAVAGVITAAMLPALASLAAAAWTAMAPFLPFIAIAAALGLALDDLWTFMDGGESAFEHLLRWMGQTDEQVEQTRALLRDLGGILGGFGDLIAAAFTFDGAGITAAIEDIYSHAADAWENLLRIFGASEESIEAMGAAVRTAGGLVQSLFRLFTSLFSLDGSEILGALKDVQNSLNNLMGAFGNLLGMIKNKLVNLLPDWMKNFLGVGNAPEAPAAAETPALAGAAAVPAGPLVNSRSVQNNTSIGSITVETKATDAEGVAREIGTELRNRTDQADGAYGA